MVFHLAAIRITQCAEEPRLAIEVLVDGTFNVVEAAAAAGVSKVVAASSASVYGLADEFPTDRDATTPTTTARSTAPRRRSTRALLRSFNDMYGLDYVALRYFNVYGPRMDIHGVYTEVLIRWMERIDAGEPPLILGDGLQTMDFVYVADIARANVLAADARRSTDEVFNVASGVGDQPRRARRRAARGHGPRPRARVRPGARGQRRRPAGWPTRQHGRASSSASRPRSTCDDGLRGLVDWWRAERAARPERASR